MATTTKERGEIKSQQWSYFDEEFKESSRAHADDISRKLRLISCFLSKLRRVVVQSRRSPTTNRNFWLRTSTTGGTQNVCRSSGMWESALRLIVKAPFSYHGETSSGNGRTLIVLWLLA